MLTGLLPLLFGIGLLVFAKKTEGVECDRVCPHHGPGHVVPLSCACDHEWPCCFHLHDLSELPAEVAEHYPIEIARRGHGLEP